MTTLTNDQLATIHQRLNEIGAAPSLETLRAFALIHRLGEDMRNGYTTKKSETLKRLRQDSSAAQASNNPAKVAEGLLIEAFLIGWIGIENLG
ncbi:hypothetical protein DCO45_09745 [Comamonas sp. JNW]|nr:hypothetical protein DCO45_09745 [Comamonas sp. JNW]